MKVKSITSVGKKPVYDLSVEEVEHYVLKNGVVTHNTGIYYSANNIWIIGRQQEKDGADIIGYNFIINIEKSRFVKEKSKIPLMVTYDGGINKYGSLVDLGLESGHVIKPKNGWYQRVDVNTGEVSEKSYRLKDILNEQFWAPVLSCQKFIDFVKHKYQLPFELMEKVDDVNELMDQLEGDE